MKITPQARRQALAVMTEALVKTGLSQQDAEAAAAVMVDQAAAGLEAGRKPEDPGFITSGEAEAMASRLKGDA